MMTDVIPTGKGPAAKVVQWFLAAGTIAGTHRTLWSLMSSIVRLMVA